MNKRHLNSVRKSLEAFLLEAEPGEEDALVVECERELVSIAAAALALADNRVYGVRFAVFYGGDGAAKRSLARKLARLAPANLKTFYPDRGRLIETLKAVGAARRTSPREAPSPSLSDSESNLSLSGTWTNVGLYCLDLALALDPVFYFIERQAYREHLGNSITRFCGGHLTESDRQAIPYAYGVYYLVGFSETHLTARLP